MERLNNEELSILPYFLYFWSLLDIQNWLKSVLGVCFGQWLKENHIEAMILMPVCMLIRYLYPYSQWDLLYGRTSQTTKKQTDPTKKSYET